MKKIVSMLAVLLAVSVLLTGCDQPRHRRHNPHQNQVVHTYRTHQSDDTWLYWYLINDNNHYYYYSSPTPLTSYSGVNWQTSNTEPEALAQATGTVENLGDQTAPETDLGTSFESEITANETADFASEAPSSDMSSDSGSFDSGSSGGDSGGGDGGGGGGE